MNKIFSHRVTFQIISVVAVILLINSFMQSRNLKEYVYERVDIDLDRAIKEIEYMNERIASIYREEDLQKAYRIDTQYIISLDRFHREVEKIFNLSRGLFKWYDLDLMVLKINSIEEKGKVTDEDKKYLKSAHNYNDRIVQAYYKILEENKIDRGSLNRDHSKIKKVYSQFMVEASKIAMEEEYRRIRRYRVDKEETETEKRVKNE